MDRVTNELLNILESHKQNNAPEAKDLENPNYKLYTQAPYWKRHQAICLLSGIAVIDADTFRTLLILKGLKLEISKVLSNKKNISKFKRNIHFAEYLYMSFPIPHKKLNYIKNISKRVDEAIEKETIPSKVKKTNGINSVLLPPPEIIKWAMAHHIPIPAELAPDKAFDSKVNPLFLPETFPDEINVYGKWRSLLIEYNLSRVQSFTELGYSPALLYNPNHLENLNKSKTSCPKAEKLSGNNEKEPSLTKRALDIYKEIVDARRRAVDLLLQEMFSEEEKSKYLELIEKCGTISKDEFSQYNEKGPKPKQFEHRCRAIGQVLRFFNEKKTIKELEADPYMAKFGWVQDKNRPLSGTFRKWMNNEGIYDRSP